MTRICCSFKLSLWRPTTHIPDLQILNITLYFSIVQANEAAGEIVVQDPSDMMSGNASSVSKSFNFDAVFGENSTQRQVYDMCAAPIVESVLNGFNGTIFAYGQTGTGKTYTMEGESIKSSQITSAAEIEKGIIPNSFQHIFDRVAVSVNQQFLVRASYLEIYNEEIRDLLSKDPRNKLELKEHPDSGAYVKDLRTILVRNVAEINRVMETGKRNRSTGATLMNQASSRSHSVFTVIVECGAIDEDGSNACPSNGSKQQQQIIQVGKLNLVDLAGSERQGKTGSTGDRFKEATKINLSLSALGNVISALVDGRAHHIPYRDSKLTRLLQSSLGGNTKTVMCANCGPADYNYDETLSTLRYANRAKSIKNKPHINEDPKDTMLREFRDEICRLKEQLATQDKSAAVRVGSSITLDSSAQSKNDGEFKEDTQNSGSGTVKQLQKAVAKAEKDKEDFKFKAKRELDALQSKSLEEKEALNQRLMKETEDRRILEQKLFAMETKLIQGGTLLNKTHQHDQLRQSNGQMDEQQQKQRRLAQELAIKEEANLVLEDQYSSLQEEVAAKTRKLERLVGKYRSATREVQDLQSEFQREREDLLETIRELTRQLKFKDMVVEYFVPPEITTKIKERAIWNEEQDTWTMSSLHLTGNNLQHVDLRRRIASPASRRPETRFARAQRLHDKDPAFRADNLLDLELDMEDGAPPLQHYSDAVKKKEKDSLLPLQRILKFSNGTETPPDFDKNSEETILFPVSSPYLRYADHHLQQASTNILSERARK